MAQFPININMPAGDGIKHYEFPAKMSYVSIMNPTDNKLEIYQAGTSIEYANPKDAFLLVPDHQSLTVPFDATKGTQFTIIWRDGGSVVPEGKNVNIIVSDVNLGIQGAYGGSVNSMEVTLAADMVGLARENQLPSSLDASGNLKVAIQGGGTIRISGSDSNFTVDVNPQTAKKSTVAAAGQDTIKSSGGNVYAISVVDAITVKLLNGSTEVFAVVGPAQINCTTPIRCGTSIKLDFSDAGDAYIQYS